MQVFGPPWDADSYDDSEEVPTPVGRPCLDCQIPIKDGDQGYVIPYSNGRDPATLEPHHRLCFHRHIMPPHLLNIPGYNT